MPLTRHCICGCRLTTRPGESLILWAAPWSAVPALVKAGVLVVGGRGGLCWRLVSGKGE